MSKECCNLNYRFVIEGGDGRVRRPQLFGDGSEAKDFVYAGDVARAICLALESEASDVALNTSGGRPISTKELVALVARIAGSDMEPEYIADDGRVRLPTGAGLHFINARAREVLGWEPQMDFEEGVRRLLADHERRKARNAGG